MTILDANILIYAYNEDAPEQRQISTWLAELFVGQEQIGLAWLTLWAFIRISTHPRLTATPLPAAQAFRIVRTLLEEPGVTVIEPGPRYAEIFEHLVVNYRISGPIMTDAALAALAIEHGATLASTDRDFSRFPNLRWINPLAPR